MNSVYYLNGVYKYVFMRSLETGRSVRLISIAVPSRSRGAEVAPTARTSPLLGLLELMRSIRQPAEVLFEACAQSGSRKGQDASLSVPSDIAKRDSYYAGGPLALGDER